MFTGIVAAVGRIAERHAVEGGVKLIVDCAALDLEDVALGDSIAVNGVCLTVIERAGSRVRFDVSNETLNCTVGFEAGASVNLEKALRLADRLGGHLVSGHVDGVGEILDIAPSGENWIVTFGMPAAIARYVARKGSIAVDGVSLTVNTVGPDRFTVNLIPHSIAATGFRDMKPGMRVNLEVDTFARYIERMLEVSRG